MNGHYETLVLDQGHQEDVLALKLSGIITSKEMKEFNDHLDAIIAADLKARVLIDLTAYEGFDSSLVIEKFSHLKAYWKGIKKLAYIIDEKWMQQAIGFADTLTPMNMRAFSHDQKEEAKAWLLKD